MSEFDKKISALTSGGDSVATDQYVIARADNSNYKISGALVAAAATKVGTLASLAVTGNVSLGADVVLSRGAADRLDLASGDSLNIVSGTVKIAGTDVLGATTLGSGVTASSLTSVGTLASLAVTGAATIGAGTESLPSLTTTGDLNTGVYFPAADTVGIATGGSERVQINATGVGLSVTPSARLDLLAGSDSVGIRLRENASNLAVIQITDNPVSVARVSLGWTNSTTTAALGTTGLLSFQTAGTERARITAGGYFKASNDGTYNDATAAYHELFNTVNDSPVAVLRHNGNSTPNGSFMTFANASPNNGTQYFALFADNAAGGTTRIGLYSNGGISNFSANNVNLASDERLKKDISPLASTWDKLKAMEVVNFRYKDCNEGDPALYGVIAQQVQPIVPELVVVTREAKEAQDAIEAQDAVLDEEGNVLTPAVEAKPAIEAAPEYYGIREQPMYWLAIKALQEAMARIESLEARLDALEN